MFILFNFHLKELTNIFALQVSKYETFRFREAN